MSLPVSRMTHSEQEWALINRRCADWWAKRRNAAARIHECNDCGILIEDHRPICALCERWYEEHGIPLPKPEAA